MLAFIKENRGVYALIAVYTLLAHLLLLLNDLPFWDGFYYFFNVFYGETEKVVGEWRDNGRVVLGWVYWGLCRLLGPILGMRLLLVACTAVSGMLAYALLTRHTRLSRQERLAVTLLGCSFPAYQVHLVSTTYFFMAAMPLFLGGVLMLLESTRATARTQLKLRIGAQLCLLAAYVSEAYVLTGLALPFLLWCHAGRPEGLRGLVRYHLRYADCIVVSLAYLTVMTWLMPVQGSYAHSRSMNLHPLSLLSYYITYLMTGLDIVNIVTPFYNGKLTSRTNLLIWGLLLLVGLVLVLLRRPDAATRHRLACGALALLLISAISVPFVAATRGAATIGWEMRHIVPIGFMAALVMVCTVSYFLQQQKLRHAALLLLVVLCPLSLMRDYTIWLTRGAFDHSVIENLRASALMQKPGIFFVPAHRYFFDEVYRNYEWERMMEAATGNRDHWVIMAQPPLNDKLWQEQYGKRVAEGENTPVTPETCQMVFIPVPSVESVAWHSGLEYLWRKYTESTDEVVAWLRPRVRLEFMPLKNCG